MFLAGTELAGQSLLGTELGSVSFKAKRRPGMLLRAFPGGDSWLNGQRLFRDDRYYRFFNRKHGGFG